YEPRPILDERLEQVPVGTAVRVQAACRLIERTEDEASRTVVQRMCKSRRRLDQIEIDAERPEERRGGGEGMDRRADVVAESRARQLGGAGSAADRVLRFEHENRPARGRECERRREAVRAGADD